MWDVIDLSRWQFALTALYHFLFVPLIRQGAKQTERYRKIL